MPCTGLQLSSIAGRPGLAFGAADAAAEQDGEHQVVRLFFTGGLTDYPIITMEVGEVCAGVKYYNKNGTLVRGTKECFALTADGFMEPELVEEDKKDGVLKVRYGDLPMYMLEGLRDLRAEKDTEIAQLRAKNTALHIENETLQMEIGAIKSYLCAKDPSALLCH